MYYAEVCNEINPNDENIIKYLDLVRERAGIPGYKELATKSAPYGKNIIGNQDLQREAIYRERIIEMLGEGNYYFDMHRWMRAGWSQDEATGEWTVSYTHLDVYKRQVQIYIRFVSIDRAVFLSHCPGSDLFQ